MICNNEYINKYMKTFRKRSLYFSQKVLSSANIMLTRCDSESFETSFGNVCVFVEVFSKPAAHI